MMKGTSISWSYFILYSIVIFVAVTVLLYIIQVYLPGPFDNLVDIASVANIFTLLALILVFFEYRRQLVFDRTQQGLEFMLRFYDNQRLDEFRKILRNQDDKFSAFEKDGSLKDEIVLGMNYFEALAIAVGEGVLHSKLVDQMLGTVICELGRHPMSKVLSERRFHYKNFYRTLLPEIKKLRDKQNEYCYDPNILASDK